MQMVSRQMKELGLECVVMAGGKSLASALDSTPQYSKQECMPSRHAKWRI
jgi:hypothetical protein